MKIYDKILIFLKLRKPPKFKIGDRVRNETYSYICQDGIVEGIDSDRVFCYCGYSYLIRWEDDEYRTSYTYEDELVILESAVKEYKYDQSGDTEDDI